MKWFTLLLMLGSGAVSAACPDYFNVEMRELNSTQRHNLCQLTEGKVVLVVNTASYCGYSGQFRDLEALYQGYKEKGLMVLGFPSNDFWQEAGNENKTAEVCRRDYGVTFPMFNRVAVRGSDAVPLFKGLTAAADGDAPNWNFHKYLVGRDGKLIASYGANQNPSDDPLKQQIIDALGH
ncbi:MULTISPECIES: glutathione peroxidase [Aeromonas]|uniref:Glutathione peroxidase n=1 Tax=Aeromonas caviae TaxID=648 RepID=A0A3S5WV83_AERCA|nr:MULTISPECIES: glutathione peroxidase [Aeromonas]AUY10428.1 glutathione peroxidase [Aeromonas sp. ASNIH2]AXB04529.1 glutathione peroxidase [Aeromonas caviae]AXB10578.1 glutathione peroxidase [Aeromonas caviae]MBA8780675.1 glutathione peroxidase [Aeromonas caviae]MBA8784730.1 glutathione peroxidase [Aeromonas sp. TW 6]